MFTVEFLWNVLYITDNTLTSSIFIWGIIRRLYRAHAKTTLKQDWFLISVKLSVSLYCIGIFSLAYMFCTSYNISESSFHVFMQFTFVQHYMPLKTTVTEDMNEQCNELHVLDVT